MVKTIQEGRKTITRRIINPQPDEEAYYIVEPETRKSIIGVVYDYNQGDENPFIKSPWQIGDLLWVRESFVPWELHQGTKLLSKGYYYKANFSSIRSAGHHKWKPSIFMPKDAARIWLEVTRIKVESLHEITVEEAICEGIRFDEDSGYFFAGDLAMAGDAINCFENLWVKINGRESWDADPWVWVVEFKVLSITGKPKPETKYEHARP